MEAAEIEAVKQAEAQDMFDRMSLVTARLYAQDMVEHLTVAYWIEGTSEDSGYHKNAAMNAYNKLTEILKNNGMLQ